VNQSEGCDSYNEMVLKADKDIADAFDPSITSDVLVCFRPHEDVFFLISYHVPYEADYRPSTTLKTKLEANTYLAFSRYKDGVLEDSSFSYGSWTKYANLPTILPSFRATSNNGSSASIDSSEVSFNTEFKNLNGTNTSYNIQIRLSTLRFSENYTAQLSAPGKPMKSPPTTATPTESRITYNGYCGHFKPGA
jgi:hypothetical protein